LAVERKYERDIDLLLAEEFAVSPAFAAWFLTYTGFAAANARVVDVYVSKSDNGGESDLVVVFEDAADGSRFALLIEDKIDAPFQPDQEARYRLRGQAAVSRGEYIAYEVILCSPATYPMTQPKGAELDRLISYESISEFLKTHDDTPRGAYRANFVATAASRNANTWVRTVDEATNAFWQRAYEMATREFPILEMKEPTFSKGNLWVGFRPSDMPTRPRQIYVQLKGDRGFIDLTFTGSLVDRLTPLVAPFLETDMTVHRVAASAAIRLRVDAFQVTNNWETVVDRVRFAFAACQRLITFYRQHRHNLDAAALAALPAP
jgi:hypothetical protein